MAKKANNNKIYSINNSVSYTKILICSVFFAVNVPSLFAASEVLINKCAPTAPPTPPAPTNDCPCAEAMQYNFDGFNRYLQERTNSGYKLVPDITGVKQLPDIWWAQAEYVIYSADNTYGTMYYFSSTGLGKFMTFLHGKLAIANDGSRTCIAQTTGGTDDLIPMFHNAMTNFSTTANEGTYLSLERNVSKNIENDQQWNACLNWKPTL